MLHHVTSRLYNKHASYKNVMKNFIHHLSFFTYLYVCKLSLKMIYIIYARIALRIYLYIYMANVCLLFILTINSSHIFKNMLLIKHSNPKAKKNIKTIYIHTVDLTIYIKCPDKNRTLNNNYCDQKARLYTHHSAGYLTYNLTHIYSHFPFFKLLEVLIIYLVLID